MWEAKIRKLRSRQAWTKPQDPIKNIMKTKMAWSMAQVVECLPRKLKVLHLNPHTAKKQK
jgi:hypothetical protein